MFDAIPVGIDAAVVDAAQARRAEPLVVAFTQRLSALPLFAKHPNATVAVFLAFRSVVIPAQQQGVGTAVKNAIADADLSAQALVATQTRIDSTRLITVQSL
jgi:hypothetical protein